MDKIKFKPAKGPGCYICQTESTIGEPVTLYIEICRLEIDKLRKVATDNPVDHVSVNFNNVWFRFGWLDEETTNDFPEKFINYEVEPITNTDDPDDDDGWQSVNNTLRVGPTWWSVEIMYPDYVHAYSAIQSIDL